MPTDEERIAQANQPAEIAMRLHAHYRGKIQIAPKCPIRGIGDFSYWYTPGVAAPCRAIQAKPDLVYTHTNKANLVAVVSDGSRVLGLGNIGPEAGLPVMEGKALLFKYLGGVDAVPLCLRIRSPAELIDVVLALEPSFGGINLEDIAQPKCFQVLDALRSQMKIPVWHDDQQGSATVVLAGLTSALKIVGKRLNSVKIAMIGMGAANVATYRLLLACGAEPGNIVACDSQGTLHTARQDIARQQSQLSDKWRVCRESNAENIVGDIAAAMRGADVCIAFSTPGPETISREAVQDMAKDAIVFACANPVPEIWPWVAKQVGAQIVATGRSDFPNQVNNSLAFPSIFRGALDVRARTISDEMAMAAAFELAAIAEEQGLAADHIVPCLDDWKIFPRVATATGMKAQEQKLAALSVGREQLLSQATHIISDARQIAACLQRDGLIPALPD